MKNFIKTKQKEFLIYLEEIRGYSDLTIKSYAEILNEAFSVIEIVTKEDVLTLNLMPYRIEIASLNSKTISKKLSAIRSFVSYLNDNLDGKTVLLKADDSIKVAKTLPKPVLHKHIEEAMKYCNLQEKVILVLFYTLGVRISELLSIKLDDISAKWIRVLGKGAKQRDIPLLGSTKDLLDEYILYSMSKRYLFEKNGEKLSQNSLRYILVKIFKRVGLKVTPHQLRHSFASELINHGAPIVDVSELLGHVSMSTTQIYTKLGSALKQKNYNLAHPLCGEAVNV